MKNLINANFHILKEFYENFTIRSFQLTHLHTLRDRFEIYTKYILAQNIKNK